MGRAKAKIAKVMVMMTVCESVNFGSQAKMPDHDSLSEMALKGGKELMMRYTWGKNMVATVQGAKNRR